MRLLRSLHLHRTPARLAARLEAQLAPLAERLTAVGEDALLALAAGEPWEGERPPLLVAAFNGYRENADVLAPILDRLGLVGWFFVPPAFVETPPADQVAFAAAHGMRFADPPPDGRLAMTWDELAGVARRHVVASHGRTHVRLAGLAEQELDAELAGSRHELETRLDRPVRTFAGLGAPAPGEDPALDAAFERSGYELVYARAAIHRLPSRA